MNTGSRKSACLLALMAMASLVQTGTIPWRQWHPWGVARDAVEVALPKGVSVLTVRTVTNGHLNVTTFDSHPKGNTVMGQASPPPGSLAHPGQRQTGLANSKMTSLKGKWSLVTGASRGVGSHVSKGLAQLGSNIVLHSREVAHTRALASKLEGLGVKVVAVSGELSDQAQVDAMLDTTLRQAGEIDILYNNAAIMTPWRENPWDIPAEDFRRSFEVNVISLARICYRLVPPMLARKWGRVINLTSGIMNEPQLTPYAISKAAVDKFVRDFVPQLAGSGVQMNLLDPGWLRTDLGGPKAPNDPSSVIPGALVPALLDDGESGRFFRAQDYAGLSLPQALEKALLK